MAYVLSGTGTVGDEAREIREHQLAAFGPGDAVVVRAASDASEPLEVLLLGGQPLREPVAQYGPFVMNTEAEIHEAIRDFQDGKMGRLPADDGDVRRG